MRRHCVARREFRQASYQRQTASVAQRLKFFGDYGAALVPDPGRQPLPGHGDLKGGPWAAVRSRPGSVSEQASGLHEVTHAPGPRCGQAQRRGEPARRQNTGIINEQHGPQLPGGTAPPICSIVRSHRAHTRVSSASTMASSRPVFPRGSGVSRSTRCPLAGSSPAGTTVARYRVATAVRHRHAACLVLHYPSCPPGSYSCRTG